MGLDDSAEQQRLASLKRFGVFETPAERSFDDLAALAAQLCSTPIAMVCFVGEERQAFKAHVGLDLDGTSRDVSFCAHAIQQHDLFVINDASADPRFASNPLVVGAPQIRFYAGAPLVTSDGQALGTVCVIDRVPRELDSSQREGLQALARQAVSQLELRLALSTKPSAARRAEHLLRAITEATATVTGAAFFVPRATFGDRTGSATRLRGRMPRERPRPLSCRLARSATAAQLRIQHRRHTVHEGQTGRDLSLLS